MKKRLISFMLLITVTSCVGFNTDYFKNLLTLISQAAKEVIYEETESYDEETTDSAVDRLEQELEKLDVRNLFEKECETESGLNSIDNTAITHSSLGDFTYNPKTGAVSKMKGGGHGQANIEFLEANGLKYNIVKVYDNGVRIGNVPDHKVKAKRTGTNQSWFPESWSESDIANAGAYIGNLPQNVNVADGVTVFGNYNGVRVGVIRTNGRISTIFPDAASQP